MEVKVTPTPRPLPPPTTYAIEGLTEDEALFFRDLLGRFSCNPGDGGTDGPHCHAQLYVKLLDVTGRSSKRFSFYDGHGRELIVHCERLPPAE